MAQPLDENTIYDVLIAVITAVTALAGWVLLQVVQVNRNTQRLDDHIKECDKRAADVWAKLESIEHKLDRWR